MTRLALVPLAVLLIGCASPRQMAHAPEPAPTGAAAGDTHHEIETLWQQLEADRTALELQAGSALSVAVARPSVDPRSCQTPPGPRCTESCRLADAICDNAGAICRLAEHLDDTWADDRCTEAQKTCTAARERCCTCKA